MGSSAWSRLALMVGLVAISLNGACAGGSDREAPVPATAESSPTHLGSTALATSGKASGRDHACLEIVLDPPTDYAGDLGQARQVAQAVIESRLLAFGVQDGSVSARGPISMRVDVPGLDTTEASELIGRPRVLQFLVYNEAGATVPAAGAIDGQTTDWVGAYVARAVAISGEPALDLELTSTGAEILRQVSTAALRYPIGDARRLLLAALDGEIIFSGMMQRVVSDRVRITGLLSPAAAADLATSLNAGALPLPIRVVDATAGPCN